KDRPFTVIQEGLDAQDDKAMVAVAAGTYVENLFLTSDHSGVHLAGRCRELVTIDGSGGSPENWEEGSGIYMAGMTGSWTVSGVTVTGAPMNGIFHYYGTLALDRVSVNENQIRGIESDYGTLVATDCRLQGNLELGLHVGGSSVTLQGVQVLDTQPDANGEFGRGISVVEESTLEATDCLLQGNHDVGLFVQESSVMLEGVQVLDTQPNTDGELGRGINLQPASTLVATDCLLQGNHVSGLYANDSSVTLDHVQFLDTQLPASGERGRGIDLVDSTMEATDCLLQGNHDVGL
ncbi:MAG: right-handed parallel beta-helix repeat-containing protein, partial [Myxococcota bacterium]|nr:right-handed parallel beta-helix repeat-containing protein [Myxococcota bacterium]